MDDDDKFGFYEAECAGCEEFARVDDVELCFDCSVKLERDIIRERDWDYSAMAFGVPPEKREELRRHIIKEHGEALELITPSGKITHAIQGQVPDSNHMKNKRRTR